MAGRPKKPDAERRDSLLKIRLTEAELKAISAAAGDTEVSTWARERLLAHTARATERRTKKP
jgi:hypothetical protein